MITDLILQEELVIFILRKEIACLTLIMVIANLLQNLQIQLQKFTVSLDSISSITKSSIKNKQTIAARFYQYNSSILKYSGVKTKEVYYYKAPGAPTGINYSTDNKYGKYTPTSKITFKWTKPSSGCDGYRIRIWRNGSQIKINGDSYIYDRAGGDTALADYVKRNQIIISTKTFNAYGTKPSDAFLYIQVES